VTAVVVPTGVPADIIKRLNAACWRRGHA